MPSHKLPGFMQGGSKNPAVKKKETKKSQKKETHAKKAAPAPDPAAGVAPPVATIPADVAAQTLNNISTREGARPPSFSFDEGRTNGQTLFQAECKWVVQGHRLVMAGEECSSKKAAKADAALAMLRHCEQIGLLLFEQPVGKAAPE